MPRTGDVYSAPAGTKGIPDTTIQSNPYNTFIDDLVSDANAARPIVAGGTGANNATDARVALGALASADILAAPTKAVPVDADGIVITDSENAGALKRVLLSVLKALLQTANDLRYLRGDIVGGTAKALPADADKLYIGDSADSFKFKTLAWSVIKSLFVLKAGDTMTGNLATSGKFTSAQAFDSSSTLAILAATGAGTVSLRPNGVATASGQAVVSTNGDLAASGKVTAASVFDSSTGNAFLASSGSGGVVALRPNGGGSTVGQAVLSSSGNFASAGDVAAGTAAMQANTGVIFGSGYNGGNVLAHVEARGLAWRNDGLAQVMNTIAGQGAGLVGTYIFATGTETGQGNAISGTNLAWSNAAAGNTQGVGGGSYICCGRAINGSAQQLTTLWKRFA